MSIGHWAAIAVTCFLARELWSGVAFVPWSPRWIQMPLATGRMVRRDDYPLAYWLAVGLHSAMVTLSWWLALA